MKSVMNFCLHSTSISRILEATPQGLISSTSKKWQTNFTSDINFLSGKRVVIALTILAQKMVLNGFNCTTLFFIVPCYTDHIGCIFYGFLKLHHGEINARKSHNNALLNLSCASLWYFSKLLEKKKSSDIPIFVKLLYQAVKLHKCETKKFKISHCVILYHHRPPTLCIWIMCPLWI